MRPQVSFKKKVGGIGGTYNKNQRLYFDITHILSVVLGFFFQQNMGVHYNLDSCV